MPHTSNSKQDGEFERTDMWREGKWLDLWSVVHAMSGISIAFIFYLLRFGAFASVMLVLVSLIAYEMWEMLVSIEEAPTNRFSDVVVGMAGFVPTFFIFAPRLNSAELILVLGLVLTTNVVMSVFGWHASQKAALLKERMHTRYGVEKARLLKQKTRFNQRFHRTHRS